MLIETTVSPKVLQELHELLASEKFTYMYVNRTAGGRTKGNVAKISKAELQTSTQEYNATIVVDTTYNNPPLQNPATLKTPRGIPKALMTLIGGIKGTIKIKIYPTIDDLKCLLTAAKKTIVKISEAILVPKENYFETTMETDSAQTLSAALEILLDILQKIDLFPEGDELESM